MVYKATVKETKNTYILVDIPDLGIENVMVKYILAPYSVPSKIGIKMNLPKEGDTVFIIFMNEKTYSNPVIIPLVSVSELQNKKELVIHTELLKVIGEDNQDVNGIEFGKINLTEAVRYDALLQIIYNIFNILLQHKHIVPFPPGATTITLAPDDIIMLTQKLNPDVAIIVGDVLKKALKSKKVKLE